MRQISLEGFQVTNKKDKKNHIQVNAEDLHTKKWKREKESTDEGQSRVTRAALNTTTHTHTHSF